MNPLLARMPESGVLFLDGGLATELEARGHDLSGHLWSADLLIDAPDAIREVHEAYLDAGSDCVITSSYQATLEGLRARGLDDIDAMLALKRSVALARAACAARKPDALVAASIGPYGAGLADGSEYTGIYPGMSEDTIRRWHAPRWRILASAGADLMACETIPSFPEVRALARLLQETPDVWAWFSFSCADGEHLRDGTPIVDCVRHLESIERIAAVGVNCTAPRHVAALLAAARSATDRPLLAYPNSGEDYDVAAKSWKGGANSAPDSDSVADFARLARDWRAAGASILGGCCRTGPGHIRELVKVVS